MPLHSSPVVRTDTPALDQLALSLCPCSMERIDQQESTMIPLQPYEAPRKDTQCNLDPPDRCLLLSDNRSTEVYQDLIPIRDDDVVKIGRNPQSSFCISDDPGNVVSRDHCEFYVVVYDESTSHVYVRDRKSSNGTFVNNVRVESHCDYTPGYLLQHGDSIEIRPFWTFTFCDKKPPTLKVLTVIQEMESKLFQERYRISQHCLGQGSEGSVYMATEVTKKKQLVCKVVNLTKEQGSDAPGQLQRKLQETDVLRQLQHPNILTYIDAFVSPHSLFTFVELATGGDLWSFLYQRDKVEELEARVIIRQVVQGLQYIHRKGVVHRDLKPENILLACSPRSTCLRVILSDFGAYAVPLRSRMITNMGTANYQAPECKTQVDIQTAAVDIWSLGVITLTLLTHHLDIRLIGLDRLNSQQLSQYLHHDLFQAVDGLSPNGQRFIEECLRVRSLDRISAADCCTHDWLCKPKSHLAYFQELERRSLSTWNSHHQLRPMPLTLPDVTEQLMPIEEDHGRRPEKKTTNSLKLPEVQEGASQYFAIPDCQAMIPVATSHAHPLIAGQYSARDLPAAAMMVKSKTTGEIPPEEPEHTLKVNDAQAGLSHSPPKHISSKTRVTTFHPLKDCQKQPKRCRKGGQDRRRQVIEELKRANVKFLPNIPGSVMT